MKMMAVRTYGTYRIIRVHLLVVSAYHQLPEVPPVYPIDY